MINFCQDGEITGNSINIIFDRQNIRNSLPSECVCKVTMSDPKTSYRLSAPDLRLMSEYENCSSKATVYGPNDIHIRCSDKFTKGDSTKIPVNPVEVKLSFHHPPEFVWIKLDADGKRIIYRGSYMSAHALLNLLNKLRKSDKMRGKPRILSLFRNELDKFNNTEARMLDSIHHMT